MYQINIRDILKANAVGYSLNNSAINVLLPDLGLNLSLNSLFSCKYFTRLVQIKQQLEALLLVSVASSTEFEYLY
jgi:hypothetical protein